MNTTDKKNIEKLKKNTEILEFIRLAKTYEQKLEYITNFAILKNKVINESLTELYFLGLDNKQFRIDLKKHSEFFRQFKSFLNDFYEQNLKELRANENFLKCIL